MLAELWENNDTISDKF